NGKEWNTRVSRLMVNGHLLSGIGNEMKTKTNPGSFARRKKDDRQEIAAVGGAAAHMSPDEYARAYPKSKIARQKKKAIAHEWTSDEARAASLKRMPRGTSLRARKTDAGRYEYWV